MHVTVDDARVTKTDIKANGVARYRHRADAKDVNADDRVKFRARGGGEWWSRGATSTLFSRCRFTYFFFGFTRGIDVHKYFLNNLPYVHRINAGNAGRPKMM